MQNKSKIYQRPEDGNTFQSEQSPHIPSASSIKDYASEGDEFLDDAIRMEDLDFYPEEKLPGNGK